MKGKSDEIFSNQNSDFRWAAASLVNKIITPKPNTQLKSNRCEARIRFKYNQTFLFSGTKK